MSNRVNAIRKSQIGEPNGVAGINGDGAIEAIVSHRIDTLANLQALGILPVGEVVVVKNGSGVPIGFRVGDEAETAGGYPIFGAAERVSVESLTLTSLSNIVVPGLTIALPSNSLLELSGCVRFGSTASLSYNFLVLSPQQLQLLVRDGTSSSQNVSGNSISMTGAGGTLYIPPTIVATTTSSNFEVYYQKISGAQDKTIVRGDLMYRVIA